ncbi:MAG: hypothetical protein CMF62_01315 [Magnetococcales bacterium]|nr:hypothetical protein [Magnetococcales bacterium]MBA42633.1 hypothetical protein [Magnetococcales bacterium]
MREIRYHRDLNPDFQFSEMYDDHSRYNSLKEFETMPQNVVENEYLWLQNLFFNIGQGDRHESSISCTRMESFFRKHPDTCVALLFPIQYFYDQWDFLIENYYQGRVGREFSPFEAIHEVGLEETYDNVPQQVEPEVEFEETYDNVPQQIESELGEIHATDPQIETEVEEISDIDEQTTGNQIQPPS